MARSAGTARAERMVGRAEQRARLHRALDDVVADGSRFVIVGGEAGAGKTTVIEAFVGDLFGPLANRHAQLIRGQCVPMGGDGLPYAPIVGALRDLVTIHGREQVLEWAGVGRSALGALLPDLAAPPVGGDAVRLQLFEAITLLWERASVKGPLVVVIEDIHWADESTRHLLRFLARALTDAPVLIVASYRTDELTRRHPLRPFLAEVGRFPGTVRVEVPNLDRAEVAELLTQLLDRPPSNPVIEAIYRRSEGIPYFVEELTRSASRGCIDMPDTLRDALNVRVQALSDGTVEILQLAAVAGNRVDHDLLEAVSGVPAVELEGALREAVDAAVLVADDTGYRFRHALLREVIHDDLLPGQHARLHARFAALLEARPELVRQDTAPLEIAHHWSAAHETNKAFRWSITATRTPSLAYNETLKMYERALELWDQVVEPESVAGPHPSVLLRAAKVAEDAGEMERALALATAALDETDAGCDPEDRIDALILKARLLFSLIRPGTVETLREAFAILPADAEPRLRARVLEELARRLMLSGNMAEGNETARLAIAAAVDADSTSVEANARTTLGTGLLALGAEDEGLAEFARASSLIRENSRTALRYYINYSDGLHLAGRYADALDQAVRGVQVARDLGLERSLGAMLAGNAAEPLIALGEWDRARTMIRRALELEPPLHHQAHLRLLQAWLSVWRGELDAADATLLDFRPLIDGDQPSPQYAGFAIRADATHALAAGDLARAWFDTEGFLDRAGTYNRTFAYEMLAIGAAAARALDQQEGKQWRTALVRDFYEHRASAVAIRGLWGPVIEAELSDDVVGWRSAVAALRLVAAPAHLPPYAGLRLAEHLVAGRERVEAKEVLATALGQARSLGAGLLIGRLAALAQRAGLSASTDIQNPIGGLTPREVEVLGLVAAGRSNGEIGSTLFITTKTASVHVSNILAKLGVNGRGEAAAVAHRAGLSGPR